MQKPTNIIKSHALKAIHEKNSILEKGGKSGNFIANINHKTNCIIFGSYVQYTESTVYWGQSFNRCW
jgi:hypothetical protein